MITSLNTKGKLLQILVAFVLSVGLIFPTGTVVLAEDTVPPTTQEEAAPADPVAPSDPAAPADPVVPVEAPVVEASAEPPAQEVPADPTVDAPVIDPTTDPVVTAEPVIANAPAEVAAVVEEAAVEIIQAAAENNVTLADASGEPLTLATAETAELLTTGDPFFWVPAVSGVPAHWEGYSVLGNDCPLHVTCHAAANPFQAAITAAPTGAMIYVKSGSYAENLIIDKANLSFTGYTTINANTNGTVQITQSGTATVNKITLNVNFNNTTSVYSGNIFINSGATLVDALTLLSPSGGIIELGTGVFDDDLNVNVNKSVEIKGQGSGQTTLLAATPSSCTGTSCPSLLNIGASNVKIHDLKLDGKNDGDSSSLDASVGISDGNNFDGLEVYNTIIQNFYSAGIFIGEDSCGGGSCDNNTYSIHNNTIQYITGASTGSGSGTDGIGIEVSHDTGSTNRTISNNIITGTDVGINFLTSQLDITGNTLNGNTYGIRGEDGSVNITNNNIFSNSYGIYIIDLDNGDVLNVHLNRLKGNSGYGFYYEDPSGSDPTVNAERNWWGCNTGARTSGSDSSCDRTTTTRVTYVPWLMLWLNANPTSIYTSETSTLTPFMFLSNDNTNKTPVTGLTWFSLPTVLQTGTSYGSMAGNIFTAGGATGLQHFSTSFDNSGSVTATVQVKGDTDGDKVQNENDNCPGMSNPSQTDTDGDGSGDACDSTPTGDTDLDGIDNAVDNCPSIANTDQADTDGDGSGNACDSTPNGDTDLDGIDNAADNCPTVANADQADTDGDGSGNVCDSTPTGDTDLDGIDNAVDNCPSIANTDQADTDGDGSGNVCDSTPNGDNDKDGIDNATDNCALVANPDQTDNDKDGSGNACDSTPNGDTDLDGIDNAVDNCPSIANPDQADNDGDGSGNVCDSTPNGASSPLPVTILPVGGLPFDTGLIPITGGLNALSCDVANTLALPNGDKVVFSDILCDFEAALTQEFSETLLSPLPTGLTYVDGFNLEVQKNATLFNVLPQPVTNTLSFVVPDAFKGKTLKILFWDATLKNGIGDWVEIPSKLMANGEVVSAPLAQGDQRLVVSGVELTSLPTTEATLNFTGLFVLAAE